MPELPEVETLRRELSRAVKGKKIKSLAVFEPKTIRPLSVKILSTLIVGQKIFDLSRRAKILFIDLSDGHHLAVHLKMTGQLIFVPCPPSRLVGGRRATKGRPVVGGHPQKGGLDNLPNKFTRLAITFSDQSVLYFNDMRKFGWVRHVPGHEREAMLGRVGVEPLSREFTAELFFGFLQRYPKRNIKQLLLDQTLVAGIGNIYADESLFMSGILPITRAGEIKRARADKLHRAIIDVLKLSIKKKGTSFRDYKRADGTPGGFVPHLLVYGREGQPCKKCQRPIKKNRTAGRGTHFCDKCQK